MKLLPAVGFGLVLAVAPPLPVVHAASPAYDFPIYTNKPPGRQVSGQHAPASTPALTPEEAQKKFTLPPGFEIRLFASEPEVVNPVAMTWDERGRLWVVELYEYPLGAKPGETPRDRIKILEDTDGDGRADKVKVFADGLNLATGLALGNGGVYVGQAPELLFLQDTDGDDKADKRTVLKTGFGLEDRHELLNGFLWGPDGWLYMTHGVFTHSKVRDPNDPNDDGVVMNAAIGRYHPRTKKFEVFADGTSNPWGMDFDRGGNFFVSACVIDHLFHMHPGGLYARQGGTPANPYAYELLPSIVDHRHHMAAYAGAAIYQGDQYPESYRGSIFIGNIHDNAIHQDRLTPDGSSFKASFVQDLVRANDGWFMPVSTQVGPDGNVWIMDWYDRYPCYQNANADPEGVDREHGRIWRVVYTGEKKGAPVPSRPDANMDLARLGSPELVKLLEHPNNWQRRTAQRLLSERRDLPGSNTLHDDTALHVMMKKGPTLEARLAALWTLHSAGFLDDGTLDAPAEDPEPALRAWAARITGERGYPLGDAIKRLSKLAKDPDPTVRLAVATAARQLVSGSLTVNTPPMVPVREVVTGGVLSALWFSSHDATDPLIPFMYWMAVEPIVAFDPVHALGFYEEDGAMMQMPLAGIILTKIMRRVCDLRDPAKLEQCLVVLSGLTEKEAPTIVAALDGLIEGQRGSASLPGKGAMEVVAKFARLNDPEVAARAQQLGAIWGDPASLKGLLARINDTSATEKSRVEAIQAARQIKGDAVRNTMLQLLDGNNPDALVIASVSALGEIGGDQVGARLIREWAGLSPAARRAVAAAMVSRAEWRSGLLSALEQKTIPVGDLPASTVRSLVNSRDEATRKRAAAAIGRYREPDADKLKLIAMKRDVVLSGEPDREAGREIAKKTCLVCHKFYGEGAEVGPDLTGVGRSTLDALLHHVINPNEVIGKGYENVEVETKDGRSVNGRLVEDTDSRVKLVSSGPKEDVVGKSDIVTMRVSELSVMPEGLEQMPDADFRNLIWYILNPPQDKKPLTPGYRRQLTGEEGPSAFVVPARDGESVALWNPEWRVSSAAAEGAPAKLSEFAGRRNVLMTHPYGAQRGAALERVLDLKPGEPSQLSFAVAAAVDGEWELRVFADDQLLRKLTVDSQDERWKRVEVDLSSLAGKPAVLRLENGASSGGQNSGYWADLKLERADQERAAK